MSPGSPDASDELQVIPRRTADGTATPGSKPPPPGRSSPPSTPPSIPPAADTARRKRLGRIVAMVALGGCALILVAAVIARAVRPSETTQAPSAGSASVASGGSGSAATGAPSSSASAAASPAAPSATHDMPPAAPPAPTTGTVVFDRPATPGRVWIDGKKITSRSVDIPCGNHKIKIGSGKTKPVTLTCGAELHLTH